MEKKNRFFLNLKGDINGGLSSAAVSLPGNIIFGMIAFAPLGGDFVSHGILAAMFASVFGGILAAFFGGTPFMISGPQAAPAIILANLLGELSREIGMASASDTLLILHIFFLCIFVSGVLQLLFGFLRLGEVVKYVSYPVAVGVINGTAVLIIMGQAGALVGLPGTHLMEILFQREEVVLFAGVISLLTFLTMLIAGRLNLKISPPLFAILLGTAMYYLFAYAFPDIPKGPTLGKVASGIPNVGYARGIFDVISDKSYLKYISIIIKGAITLAVINSLDSLLSSLMLQNLTNKRTNSNRELLGQGMGNIVSPLFGGLSASGFIGRSMVNFKSGGRSSFSVVIHSLTIFTVIALFANYISYIPRSVMAAVIVFIGVRLIDPFTFRLLKDVFKKRTAKKRLVDLGIIIVVMATAIVLDIPIALGVGVAISVMVFLSGMSRSVVQRVYSGNKLRSRKMREESLDSLLNKKGKAIGVLELEGTIFFAAAERLADYIDSLQGKNYIILDMKGVQRIDTTGYRVLEQTYKRLKQKGIILGFSYLYPGREIMSEFKNLKLNREINRAHIFHDTDKALEFFEDCLLESLQTDQPKKQKYTVDKFLSAYGFSRTEVDFLKKYLKQEHYTSGESVFVQGEKGNSLFLIVSGEADITIKLPGVSRKKRIVTLTYGTVFGEMALLDRKPRSANVDVTKDLVCYKLSVTNFNRLKRDDSEMAIKIITVISKILTQRLRNANSMISQQDT